MFQNSRPAVSNRFQSVSSTISMSRRFMDSVILRVPSSKNCCSLGAVLVRQHAQSGSSPCADCGATTSALLASARSKRYDNHSRVRNGMSHPTIKFHSSPPTASLVLKSAVMIPASGPCPSHRSPMPVMPKAAYLLGDAITCTCCVTLPRRARIRKSIGAPSISTKALSRPKRVLPPPANTYPCPLLALSLSARTLFFLDWLASRTPNSQFAQLLLQTLPMQAYRRRGPRNVPAMIHKLLGQVCDLELPLRLAKILFAQSIVVPCCGMPGQQRLASRHFLWQIRHANLFAAAQDQTPFQGILQFAYISWPGVALDCGDGFPRQ